MSTNNKLGPIRFKVKPRGEDKLTVQSNLNQFQNSFQSELCVPGTLKVTDILYYDYPVYFYYYFRAAFFLCLVPFWVNITEQTNVKLVTYKFQRVLCAIVYIFAFLAHTLWFRYEAIQSLKEHPEKVFGMTRHLCYLIYVVAYAKVVWSRKIVDLLQHIPPRKTHKVKQKGNIFVQGFVDLVQGQF